jgi:hypothetical protein
MGARPQKRSDAPAAPDGESVRARVIAQGPAVILTLVSVLVGLVLSDLVTEARTRMQLWPLSLAALRTWGQLLANGGSGVAVWIVLAHLGIARQRTPHVAETLSAFAPPVMLLAATTFVGRAEIWPWFYFASLYLAASLVAIVVNVRLTMDQPGGARFARVLRPTGVLSVIYLGVPGYLIAGVLDQTGHLSPALEAVAAWTGTPANMAAVGLFFRDWRAAVEAE